MARAIVPRESAESPTETGPTQAPLTTPKPNASAPSAKPSRPKRPKTQFADLGAALADVGADRPWFARGAIESIPIILWSGPEKSGKSWMLADLIVATVTGQAWLGRFEIEQPGDVVLLDGEYGKHETARRLARVARGRGLNPAEVVKRVKYIYSAGVTLDARNEVIRTLLEDLRNGEVEPALIAVDPLRNHLAGDENSAKDVREAMRILSALRSNGCCPVMVPHHLNKEGNYSGSRALVSRADLIVEGSDEELPWYSARGRTIRPTTDPIAKRFAVLVEHENDRDDTKARTIVRAVFEGEKADGNKGRMLTGLARELLNQLSAGGSASRHALKTALGRNDKDVKNELHKLEELGMAKQHGGRWELTTGEFFRGLSEGVEDP